MGTSLDPEWERLEKIAEQLSDVELLAKAKHAARNFVVLWREAHGREYKTNFRMSVSILQDRIGIIVEGYRVMPV